MFKNELEENVHDAGEYYYEHVDDRINQRNLKKLRRIREKVNYQIDTDRHEFLCQLYDLFGNWDGQYPNLQAIFGEEEVNWFLTESISFRDEEDYNRPGELIIKFVALSGYKDLPKIEQDGKPLERRTTAVHHAARSGFLNKDIMVRELFKIYNDFDVNYTDSSGLTHFHVACAIGCDDVVEKFLELGQDPNLLVHETGYSALHLALAYDRSEVARLLLKSGADPNLANPEGSTALHLICKMDNPNALMKALFEISDEKCRSELIDARDKEGKTALHWALKTGGKNVAKWLLRKGADPNLADKEGSTALHIICQEGYNDLAKMLFEISDKKHRLVRVDAQDNEGNTPLHFAMKYDDLVMARLLLRRGADVTLVNEDGQTLLHIVGQSSCNDVESLRMLFEMGIDDGKRHRSPVQINAKDKLQGRTPLHEALHCHKTSAVEFLLRRGADPHSTDLFGSTVLHDICRTSHDNDLIEVFFKVNDELNRRVRVDAKDNEGRTPLFWALKRGHNRMTELLMRRGADPNLVQGDDGSTPLHFICKSFYDDGLMGIFLKIMKEDRREMVPIDARDKYGRTPLQFAVARLLPNTVDVLLDHGADLSNFVFPSESNFEAGVKLNNGVSIKITSGILAVVERLETRGYELSQSDALTIMKLFAEHELFVQSADLEEPNWQDHEELAREAKETMISPSLSVHDLLHSRPREVAKRITFEEYFEFAHGTRLWQLPVGLRRSCFAHLCEKLCQGFFLHWTLYLFWELIHKRLPLECCEMITDHLTNQDLYRIFVATTEQGS